MPKKSKKRLTTRKGIDSRGRPNASSRRKAKKNELLPPVTAEDDVFTGNDTTSSTIVLSSSSGDDVIFVDSFSSSPKNGEVKGSNNKITDSSPVKTNENLKSRRLPEQAPASSSLGHVVQSPVVTVMKKGRADNHADKDDERQQQQPSTEGRKRKNRAVVAISPPKQKKIKILQNQTVNFDLNTIRSMIENDQGKLPKSPETKTHVPNENEEVKRGTFKVNTGNETNSSIIILSDDGDDDIVFVGSPVKISGDKKSKRPDDAPGSSAVKHLSPVLAYPGFYGIAPVDVVVIGKQDSQATMSTTRQVAGQHVEKGRVTKTGAAMNKSHIRDINQKETPAQRVLHHERVGEQRKPEIPLNGKNPIPLPPPARRSIYEWYKERRGANSDDEGYVVSDPSPKGPWRQPWHKNVKSREPKTAEEKKQWEQMIKDAEQKEQWMIEVPWDFTGGRFDKEKRLEKPLREGCKRKSEVVLSPPPLSREKKIKNLQVPPVIFDLNMVRSAIDNVQATLFKVPMAKINKPKKVPRENPQTSRGSTLNEDEQTTFNLFRALSAIANMQNDFETEPSSSAKSLFDRQTIVDKNSSVAVLLEMTKDEEVAVEKIIDNQNENDPAEQTSENKEEDDRAAIQDDEEVISEIPQNDTVVPQDANGHIDLGIDVPFLEEIAILIQDIAEGNLLDDQEAFPNEVLPAPAGAGNQNVPDNPQVRNDLLAEIERIRNRRGQKRTYLLATTRQIDSHRLSGFNQVCGHCSAKFFTEERTRPHLPYGRCCNRGKYLQIPPLGETPALLQNLLGGDDDRSAHFKRNILAYNHAFQFASMQANLREIPGRGPYVYAIQGKVYHGIADVNVNQAAPKYAPVYVLDPEVAVQQRVENNDRVDLQPDLVRQIQAVLQQVNIFAREYRHLGEVYNENAEQARREGGNPPSIRLEFVAQHRRRREHDMPLVSEIAVVYEANEEMPKEPTLRVFARDRNIGIKEVDGESAFCDPLTYPLLFPNGELGWNFHLDWVKGPPKVTLADFYGYRLSYRDTEDFQLIQRSGRLKQLFVVDAYIKIEKNRLMYYREHQGDMRVESYQGLTDYLNRQAEINEAQIGEKVILPSEFLGGPRSQMQKFQDAMAVVGKFGHPSLFITFTCNPTWPEITQNIRRGDETNSHPLLIARVFRAKLRELMDDINVKHAFGVPVAHLMVIEFQKRGLPHAHILVTLRNEDKPQDPIRIDQLISAEIPDADAEPRLFELVGRHMVHGPCGTYNENSVCMDDGKCTKHFPKAWADHTSIQGNFVILKRPRNFRSIILRRNNAIFTVMNPFIVPYNPYLLLKYDAHINIEPCVSIKSVKYLYKYFFKGNDQAMIKIVRINDQDRVDYDEIDGYLNGRYMTPPEASWRILKFEMHDNSHSVIRLDVHLPNFQRVFFRPGEARDMMQNRTSTLLQWFELNRNDANARQYFYHEIPLHYTFKEKSWHPRVYNTKVISRIYNVSPRYLELYCLRLMLFHVRGATSFEDLRTVDGVLCETFVDAARARHLLDDDREWHACMQEASERDMPRQMRNVFAYILVFGNVKEPVVLWNAFKQHLIEDFVRRRIPQDQAEIKALQHIQAILNDNGTRLTNFGLPDVPEVVRDQEEIDRELEEIRRDGEQNLERLNRDQREIYDRIIDAIQRPDTPDRLFYVCGAAGTGKTFLFNTLINVLNSRGLQVITVACTGLAASLLRDGRTVHSTFQLPVPTGENSMAAITPASEMGKKIANCSLIIWDEISMASRILFHAVERSLRDICKNEHPFAGKCVLVAGDFKQCLPIVVNGDRASIVEACIKSSPLWPNFVPLRLEINMRAQRDEIEFVEFIEQVGNGRLPTIRYIHHDLIPLPQRCIVETKPELIEHVFGQEGHFLEEAFVETILNRAILTPLNADCDEINASILSRIPGETVEYCGIDSILTDDVEEANRYPPEFLNSLNPPGYPPYRLQLKNNAIVMLLRNLNVRSGLVNGTRMVVRKLLTHLIEVEIIDFKGELTGRKELIPKIELAPTTATLPFILKRKQFPVKLAYCLTVNKSQGMSFDRIGILLPRPVFSHGQLYVAFSRARTFDGVRVFVERTSEQGKVRVPEDNATYTKNIVYDEVL